MPVALFYQPLVADKVYSLDEEESRHCVKVLRKGNGDEIRITDGKGVFYNAVITDADHRKCSFLVTKIDTIPARLFSVHIAVSPTKNTDRMEWLVEKMVELGVDTISLITGKNSERTFLKTDRLRKIAISAMKQSVKSWLPVINPLVDIRDFIPSCTEDGKYIAHVDFTNPLHLKDAASAGGSSVLLVGPEGDFTTDEIDLALHHGFTKVSLGTSRLRTETAAMAGCHILNLVNS